MSNKATFKAIFETEKIFTNYLEKNLNLLEIKGPLFLDSQTGLNDDLSNFEEPVSFMYHGIRFEVVHSLAKWKRWALQQYDFEVGEGLYVKMDALRPHEKDLTKYHALHVDQYDWEKVITPEQRTVTFLKTEVRKIYQGLQKTKAELMLKYSALQHSLPPQIKFVLSSDLPKIFPNLNPAQIEYQLAKKYGAFFLVGIGHNLEREVRAPDYDDWNLNGDLIVWDPVNKDALELSSMGIRVDKNALKKQHQLANTEHKLNQSFHQSILNDELPLSIGGGIGRSRVNMFLLEKANINDVK